MAAASLALLRLPRLALVIYLSLPACLANESVITPRFRWAQSTDHVFVSIIIPRDYDTASVSVSLLDEATFAFEARSLVNEVFRLHLSLREDVHGDRLNWTVTPRYGKPGAEVGSSVRKVHSHRWDRLLIDTAAFKNVMEKDWSRDNVTLEYDEELPYFDDNKPYFLQLTEANINETMDHYRVVVVNARYPWCNKCRKHDVNFARVARYAKRKLMGADSEWNGVGFAVVDAREERRLARWLGANCDKAACRYQVLTGTSQIPETVATVLEWEQLRDAIPKFFEPLMRTVESPEDREVMIMKRKNFTCLGSFQSPSSPEYAVFENVARELRGELAFVVYFGLERPVELWQPGDKTPFIYKSALVDEGGGSVTRLLAWLRPRSVALLQHYTAPLKEKYAAIGLPIAKLFIDNHIDADRRFEGTVRHIVLRVARAFLDRMVFVEMRSSSDAGELTHFGLDHPEEYPALGVEMNRDSKTLRYTFKITRDISPSVQVFWRNEETAFTALSAFCEQVLAGMWPTAHFSAPQQQDWKRGTIRELTWRDYHDIFSPHLPLLLELYGKHRHERDMKNKVGEFLAEALEPYADTFTVARFDVQSNYYHGADFRNRSAKVALSEWYWVSMGSSANATRATLQIMSKPTFDPPISDVVKFAQRRSKLEMDVEEVVRRHEKSMRVYTKFKSFVKVSDLTHNSRGFNIKVQVVSLKEVVTENGNRSRQAIVGDETGFIALLLQGDEELAAAADEGKTIEVRNAKVVVVADTMQVHVGRWGMVSPHDGEAEVTAVPPRDEL